MQLGILHFQNYGEREYFTEIGCNIVYTNLMDYKKPDIYLVKLVKIPPICNIN